MNLPVALNEIDQVFLGPITSDELPFHIFVIVECQERFERQQVVQILDRLLRDIPPLNTRVGKSFLRWHRIPLPRVAPHHLYSEERLSQLPIPEDVFANLTLDIATAPPFRITQLISDDHCRSRLIFTFHHSLCDASGSVAVVEEFLRRHRTLKDGGDLAASPWTNERPTRMLGLLRPASVLKDVRSLMSGSPGGLRSLAELRPTRPSKCLLSANPKRVLSRSLRLEADDLDALKAFALKMGCSKNAALVTGFVAAIDGGLGATTDPREYSIVFPFDCRKKLGVTSKLGNFVSSKRFNLSVDGCSVQALANSIKKKFALANYPSLMMLPILLYGLIFTCIPKKGLLFLADKAGLKCLAADKLSLLFSAIRLPESLESAPNIWFRAFVRAPNSIHFFITQKKESVEVCLIHLADIWSAAEVERICHAFTKIIHSPARPA